MEKDVDEVGKVARAVKAKLQAINKDVILPFFYVVTRSYFISARIFREFQFFLLFSFSLSRI